MPNAPKAFRPHGQTRKQVEQSWASRRDGRHAMYNDSRWKSKDHGCRVVFLRQNPLCVACDKEGRGPVVATDVDHIVPHNGDWGLFLDMENLQALCKSCHSRKTMAEQRGQK